MRTLSTTSIHSTSRVNLRISADSIPAPLGVRRKNPGGRAGVRLRDCASSRLLFPRFLDQVEELLAEDVFVLLPHRRHRLDEEGVVRGVDLHPLRLELRQE